MNVIDLDHCLEAKPQGHVNYCVTFATEYPETAADNTESPMLGYKGPAYMGIKWSRDQ